MTDTYPKRPSHFAHKAVRLAMKACVAQSYGPVAFAIYVSIAHTEDAKHYSGPVEWFDNGLIPIVGAKDKPELAYARRKLVRAGWLHYRHGGLNRPGRYWVLIPPFMAGRRDSPSDESGGLFEDDEDYNQNGAATSDDAGSCVSVVAGDSNQIQSSFKADQNEIETRSQADIKHINPIPNPIPIPLETLPPSGGERVAEPLHPREDCQKVIKAFDALGLLERGCALTDARLRKIRAHFKKNPDFLSEWSEVLTQVRASAFLMGKVKSWKVSLNWLLEPENIAKVKEGTYDNGKFGASSPSKGILQFASDTYDPDRRATHREEDY
jgi:hypothetical protein